jgi:hypothetical protein
MAKAPRKVTEKAPKPTATPVKSPFEKKAEDILSFVPEDKPLPAGKRDTFIRIYAAEKGNPKLIKSELEKSDGFNDDAVKYLTFASEVTGLTGGIQPLVSYFHKNLGANSLQEIALRYNRAQVVNTLKSIKALPDAVEGKNIAEKRNNFVADLETKLNKLEPAATKQRLRAELMVDHVLKGASQKVKDSFFNLYTEGINDWSATIRAKAQESDELGEVIARLDVAHIVNDLAGEFEPLVRTVKVKDFKSIHDVALNFNAAEVQKEIAKAAIPEDVPGDSKDAKSAHLIAKFETGLFRLAPMATVERMLISKDLTVSDSKHTEGVLKFLDRVPEFNFRNRSVYDAFEQEDAFFKDIPEEHREGIKQEVKTFLRVANLAPVSKVMPGIIKTGLTSAHQIANMPLQTYVRNYKGVFGEEDGEEDAKKIYRNAENIAIRNEHYLMAIREAVTGSGVRIIDDMRPENAIPAMYDNSDTEISIGTPPRAIIDPVTYARLFGSVDLCECDECNSVYSASAYFVELLQYLRNNNLAPGNPNTGQKGIENTPLEKLFRRRPDLGNLQLTCRNTNTILPYIDLVNEVMESFVVHHDAYATDKNNPKQTTIDAYDVEEDETKSELLSEPAHTNYDAYCILKKEVYPFTLPYHQPIDEARIFLDFLGTSRYELLKHFRSEMPPLGEGEPVGKPRKTPEKLPKAYKEMLARAADAEYLDLTEEEYVILTKQGFTSREKWKLEPGNKQKDYEAYLAHICHKKIWEYYGLQKESDLVPELKVVKYPPDMRKAGFLKRTGLLYTDLVELLKTQFINPNYLNGEALEYFKSIRYSYQFLESNVNKKIIAPKERKKRYADVVGLLKAQRNKEYPHKYPDPFIEQWVCKYFDRIGKLIVLENNCCGNIGTFLIEFWNESGVYATTDEKCNILFSDSMYMEIEFNQNEIIGKIDNYGKITLTHDLLKDQEIVSITVFDDPGKPEGNRYEGDVFPKCKADNCDITKVRLQHLDGTDLDEAYDYGAKDPYMDYDRMHRFIRLWRKLGWTIDEVDKAIMGLGELHEKTAPAGDDKTNPEKDCDDCHDPDKPGENDCIPDKGDGKHYDITPELIRQLAAVKKLMGVTGLELTKLLTFWTDISTQGEKSLYKRLFLTHNMLGLDKVFKDDGYGNFLTKPEKIKDHLPILMAALRLKSENIESILAHVGLTSDAPLTLANVSTLYRYSLLAKVLGARIDDMLEAMDLLKPVAEPFTDARSTVKFFEVYQKIEDSGMKPELLHYIVNNVENPRKPHAPHDKTIYNFAKSLRDALLKIETEHADIPDTTEVTDELIRTKTSLFFSAEVEEKIIGLLDGTTVYADNTRRKYTHVEHKIKIKVQRNPLPNPGTPSDPCNFDEYEIDEIVKFFVDKRKEFDKDPATNAGWKNFLERVQFSPNGGLQIKGCLPAGDYDLITQDILPILKGYNTASSPNIDTNFGKAVEKMRKQPAVFFEKELADVFADDLSAAKTELLKPDMVDEEDPAKNTAPGKRLYFLKLFLPFLRSKLQEQAIVQQVAGALSVDEAVARLLLKTVIQGENSPAAYDEFLKLKENQPVTNNTGAAGKLTQGFLIPSTNGDYTFRIESQSASVVSLTVGPKPLTLQQTGPDDEGIMVYESARLALVAGQKYTFELSGFDDGDLDYFTWKIDDAGFVPVPDNVLFPNLHTEAFQANYVRLQKAAWIISGLNIKAEELQYLVQNADDFEKLNFNTLKDSAKDFSLKQWLRLYEYTHLRDGLLQKTYTLLDFLKWVKTLDTNADNSDALNKNIAKLFLRKKEEIEKLTAPNHSNWQKAGDYSNARNLRKMTESLAVADKIGMDIDLLFDWAKPTSKFKTTRAIAEGIRNATRARYAQDEWEEAVKPLSDKLRTNQKQALIAYLLVQQPLIDWGVVDADSLFEFFLIDVQMEACMQTSRIKQAISSVQLFIQRCFLGLESPDVYNEDLDRTRWDWMQRYRVWEANRKVFLYPENWIEANLRDDKSPFFKELESELLQKDISKDNVTDALKAYLYKVDEVANMEVVGLYIDGTKKTDGTWNKGNKLHVFSRTRNAPYFFYYRYLALDEMNWYPWEKMQVDIPSYDVEDNREKIKDPNGNDIPNPDFGTIIGNGCYLTPVVWNGRLLVFFPQFTKKARPNKEVGNKSIQELSNNSPNSTKPVEGWEIKLAMSEYRNGKWTQKQICKDVIYNMPDDPGLPTYTVLDTTNTTNAINDIDQLITTDLGSIVNAAKTITADNTMKVYLINLENNYRKYYDGNKNIPLTGESNIDNYISQVNSKISSEIKKIFIDNAHYNSINSIGFFYPDSAPDFGTLGQVYLKLVDINSMLDDIRLKIANLKPILGESTSVKIFDIFNYEFVPKTSPELVKISVYYDSSSVGVFEFEGTRLYTSDPMKWAEPNSIEVNWFHHKFLIGVDPSDESESTIESLQVVGPSENYKISDFIFEDLSLSKINSTDFYHKYTRDLLGILNQNQLKSLFQFNLDKISDPDNFFGFGDHDQDPDTPEIYHELKKPYSLYNWELFFHTPTMLADALSKAQQFEESMKWYHYVFNPQTQGTEINRFWQFYPFQKTNSQNVLDRIFNNLKPNAADKTISEWRNKPFQPHVVARNRPVAYMKYVVMKYIDNLIEWGDYLFRQDTIESINQATQLYILAGHILGPKPQFIPKRGKIPTHTYNDLLDKWDAFGNAMAEMEILLPYSSQIDTSAVSADGNVYYANIFGFGTSLFFCIPGNPKLLGYWKTVEDRLYKIRHCENIEGVFRMLPLFEPPIDPALLVAAAAQGLSITSVLNDLNTPMPNYRFNYLLQKALELCGELKSLSNALVSAREKKDNESLSLLRAKHESHLQELIMEVKKQQLEEAQKNIEGLQYNRKSPEYKLRHYQQLIGAELSDIAEDAEFTEIANQMPALVEESGYKLTPSEKEEMDKSNEAQQWQRGIGIVETLIGVMHALPDLFGDVKPFGIGAGAKWGGQHLGNAAQATARGLQVHASDLSFASTNAGRKAGFLRQIQDRVFQANLAGHEIKQLDKQITTQEIRKHIANLEISNHQQVIDNAREVEDFLRNKYSNEELYQWMDGQIKTVYRQVYNLAFELAKKAEKVYRFEKGLASSNFIQAGYWDAGRDGLMSGERLYLALKQMEAAYAENRGHDYEITKDVSLRQLDPMALIQLKETGTCEFEIPETLFDMDRSGDYKRRIKSVSVTIPCVVGPYSSLNCTLRLLKHEYRNDKLAKTAGEYLKKTEETDERFVSDRVPITAIAVSQGQNDSGVFELNFKDERFMPFEGAGAISAWRLELPDNFRQFDYDTISDVVLQMRYTSCEGGGGLKKAALDSLIKYVKSAEELSRREGLFRMASLKHEFSTEWYRFLHPKVLQDATKPQIMELGNLLDRLPFFTKYKSVTRVDMNAFMVLTPISGLTVNLKNGSDPIPLAEGAKTGDLITYSAMELSPQDMNDDWSLTFTKADGSVISPDEMKDKDVFIVMRYQLVM